MFEKIIMKGKMIQFYKFNSNFMAKHLEISFNKIVWIV